MMSRSSLAFLSFLPAIVATFGCGRRTTPTGPDSSVVGVEDVHVAAGPAGAGSDNTERQWAAGWSVFVDAGTRPTGAPSDPGIFIPRLPTPVVVAEVSTTVVAPDGHTLTSVVTSAVQIGFMNLIAVNTGTNKVTPDRGIIVNQMVLYDISAPSPTSEAMITVRLTDGRGESHDVRIVNEIRQERPVPGPCTTRDQPSLAVRISPSGLNAMEQQGSRGMCVAFVNQDTVAHDVRSDPHPAHSDCPELSVGLIPPGSSRTSLAISTWGTCGYHDELRPDDTRFTGRFVIAGPPAP